MELAFFWDYTYYSKLYSLSSLSKGVSLTLIPTRPESRFSAYLSGHFSGRTYKKGFSEYDNNSFNLIASLGYKILPTWQMRSGISFKSNSYLLTDTPDQNSFDIFAGTNFTLIGDNSFDIEGGYTKTDLSYIPDTTQFLILRPPITSYDYFHTRGELYSYYFSPRYSRPLGSKTGLSMTFHHRHFSNGGNAVVLGTALNFISPWADLYEGNTFTISLKTILVPKMIISTGFGYWKKAFLRTMVLTSYAVKYAEKRYDEQNRLYFTFERPIYFAMGSILKPIFTIEFTHNNTTTYSMFNLYDYNNITITAGLTYEF